MSNPRLAAMDASIHAACLRAGLADVGRYFPPASPEGIDCRVYVDLDIELVGGVRQFVSGRVEVAYVLEDLGDTKPVKGGSVTVGTKRYVNAEPLHDDGSQSRWLVRRG